MLVSAYLDVIFLRHNIDYLLRVCGRKKTMCGLDGVYPSELRCFWEQCGESIKQLILSERYIPMPAERARIKKKESGKKREIMIYCVLDRMLMHGLYKLLNHFYDKTFSDSSFGFRLGRDCLLALERARMIMNSGYDYSICIDIEKCFDTINHQILFEILDKDIEDKRVLRLIKAYVKTKVACGAHVYRNYVGVPQGSALSPLLANIYLNEFDRMMDEKGYRFVRYADDIVLFARSENEKMIIWDEAEEFLHNSLKLRINKEKTVVEKDRLSYLGYEVRRMDRGHYELFISPKKKEKVFERVNKNMLKQSKTDDEWLDRLGAFNRGWLNYYKYADGDDTARFAEKVDEYEKSRITEKSIKGKSKGFISMAKWWEILVRQNANGKSKNMQHDNGKT